MIYTSMEGIRTPSKERKVIIRRKAKVDQLIGLVDQHRTVLVRASPATGKTSMYQLVEDELRAQSRTFYSLNTNEMKKFAGSPPQVFDQYCQQKIGAWREMLTGTDNFVVLVDETQGIYQDYADDFWEIIKWLQSQPLTTHGARFLFFAAYGLKLKQAPVSVFSMPFDPACCLDATFLYCTEDETAELVAAFQASTEMTVQFPPGLPQVLCMLTAGHIDMLLHLLNDLYTQFKYLAQQNQMDPGAFYSFLLSHDVSKSIGRSRGAPQFHNLPKHCRDYMKRLLYQHTSHLDTDEECNAFIDLVKCYIVRWDDQQGAVRFISPIVERLAFSALFASSPAASDVVSLEEFINKMLAAIRVDFLQHNMGQSKLGDMLEPAWQAEVYRAATSILPQGTFISHEVGHIFNSRGMVDIYINNKKQWLVEITRNGDKLAEHLGRFEGIYAMIPRQDEVVLDFRVGKQVKKSTIRKFGPKVWFVVVDSSYEFARVSRLLPTNAIKTEQITFAKLPLDLARLLEGISHEQFMKALEHVNEEGMYNGHEGGRYVKRSNVYSLI